jgi:hypothetical protein
VRLCHDAKRLGATFFLGRSGSDLVDARKFATTVAYPLAIAVPALKLYIYATVYSLPDILLTALPEQWK